MKNLTYAPSIPDDCIKSFCYLKGFFAAKEFVQSTIALNIAAKIHGDQKRKDGHSYYFHPLGVTTMLINLLDKEQLNDELCSISLLHDVIEEANCTDIVESLHEQGISDYVLDTVTLLSKTPGYTSTQLEKYFGEISCNADAALVKACDRLHNLSSAYVFSEQKLKKYIEETENYVMPMIAAAKFKHASSYNDALFFLLHEIGVSNTTLKILLRNLEKNNGATS